MTAPPVPPVPRVQARTPRYPRWSAAAVLLGACAPRGAPASALAQEMRITDEHLAATASALQQEGFRVLPGPESEERGHADICPGVCPTPFFTQEPTISRLYYRPQRSAPAEVEGLKRVRSVAHACLKERYHPVCSPVDLRFHLALTPDPQEPERASISVSRVGLTLGTALPAARARCAEWYEGGFRHLDVCLKEWIGSADFDPISDAEWEVHVLFRADGIVRYPEAREARR